MPRHRPEEDAPAARVRQTAPASKSESARVWAEALADGGFKDQLDRAIATPDDEYIEYNPRRYRR